MNNDNNSLGGSPNKRKKAYTKEQINDLPDKVIVSNLMKMASFFKNNLNMDYSDAMKKARPLVDTYEGLSLIQKIKAQNGQQNHRTVNSVAPVDLNQPISELPETEKEKQEVVKLREPFKVQGVRSKNAQPPLLEPFTSNYFLLVDIIPDLEKRLKEQDLEEVSEKLDDDILDLAFNYVYQNDDGTHMIEMVQPDGDDQDNEPDLSVLLQVDPIRKMVEVISYTDNIGNTHKVYSNIDGEIHTNHSIKTRLNNNLTEWLKGFKAQAHYIPTLEEREDQYYDSREFWKDSSDEFEQDWLKEERKVKELREAHENLHRKFRRQRAKLELIKEEHNELKEKHEKIMEVMKPIMDEMMGEEVVYHGQKQEIKTEVGFFRYLAHILRVKDNKNTEK